MAWYLLKYWKKGKRPPDAFEKTMIQSEDLLVATRTEAGVWTR